MATKLLLAGAILLTVACTADAGSATLVVGHLSGPEEQVRVPLPSLGPSLPGLGQDVLEAFGCRGGGGVLPFNFFAGGGVCLD